MVTADTNVFFYSLDPADKAKQATAKSVIAGLIRLNAIVGLQCIGELQNALRRKLRMPGWEAAQHARNLLVRFDTFQPTETAALAALGDLATARGTYFDRLLIYSAREVGCTAILTEDDQGARQVGGVEIINPFGAAGLLSDRAREVLEL